MNISLNSELERLIEQKVKSGMYNSASEVVRAGLRLLQEQEELRDFRFAELKHEIQRGIEDIEQGKVIDGDKVFKELIKRNQNLQKNKKSKK
jgi:antitoxin ParD1/3/4